MSKWLTGATYRAFDQNGGELWFVPRFGWLKLTHEISGIDMAVTEHEWQEWDGSNVPPIIGGATKIEVKLRSREILTGYADQFIWGWSGGEADIVRWRYAG